MDKKARYLSLDVFRGATVFLMILVNTPGEWGVQYSPLKHAHWHGFTLTDLVFPSFLFAVGNAMAFVMNKFEERGDAYFWKKISKRCLLIFLIGFLLNWFPFYKDGGFVPIGSVRTLGVLQRIALCYGFAAVLIHYCSRKWVIITSVLVLFSYWIILYFFGDPADPYSLAGFAGHSIDRFFIGEERLYRGEGVPFDPEGILSTFPAVVNVIIGYLTGVYIKKNGHTYEVIAKLLLAGAGLIIMAFFWDLFFPINKKIWTSSYVLLTVGIDITILASMVYIIEIVQFKKWTYFFEVFGRNPLFIYALAWVMVSVFHWIPIGDSNLYRATYGALQSFATPAHASFMFAIFFTLINWFVGYILDKQNIYIKV